jgi:hypothetical protein
VQGADGVGFSYQLLTQKLSADSGSVVFSNGQPCLNQSLQTGVELVGYHKVAHLFESR